VSLLPSKVGAEPKKLAALVVLLGTAGVVYWMNRAPSTPGPTSPPATAPAPAAATDPTPTPTPRPAVQEPPPIMPPKRVARSSGRGMEGGTIADFRPTLKLPDDTDVSKIDPTLRLDLLAKVQNVPMAGGSRSLFEFSQPPPPPTPKVKPIKPGPEVSKAAPAKPGPPPKPVKPPPPPIPLKFYGYAGRPDSTVRRAFFLDGDDIFVAGENEVVKNRYKIVRIGVNSAVVEDTTNKNQQTLKLIQELGG
jgi:hypothetical protein